MIAGWGNSLDWWLSRAVFFVTVEGMNLYFSNQQLRHAVRNVRERLEVLGACEGILLKSI